MQPKLLLPFAIAWSLAAPCAHAAWPDTVAPCNASLQACINGTVPGATLEVATNDVIDESLLINKPFVLRAAAGYRPALAAGRVISGDINAAGDWRWTVQGFELRQGFIQARVSGGDSGTITIERNRVRAPLSGAAEISVSTSAATELRYAINYNEIDYSFGTFDGSLRAGIQVLDSFANASSHVTDGQIRENRVIARDANSIGILVSTLNRAHATAVVGNQVRGGRAGSLYLRAGSLVSAAGGSLDAFVANNVVRGIVPRAADARGILIDLYDGAGTAQVVNNTVVDALSGVRITADASSGGLSGEIARNVFANLSSRGVDRFGAVTMTDARNLFFETADPPASVAASSVFANPRFVRGVEDVHLQAGSPAIDRELPSALQPLLTARALPALDGDGTRRFLRGGVSTTQTLDLGALEFGDDSFVQIAPVAAGNVMDFDDASLSSSRNPQITQNWNPDGRPSGIYDNHPMSVGYAGTGAWRIRREDLVPIATGTAYTIFVPGAGDGEYRHQPAAGNIAGNETSLSQPGLDGDNGAVVIVSRDWSGTTSITDFVSPFAVRYASGIWRVRRLDGGSFSTNGGFDVYFQAPSFNAFRQFASAGNVEDSILFLDHALLNGNRCARMQVTRGAGTANPHHIGVYYAPERQRWAIFNQDFADMPLGTEFHVLVDPRAVDCRSDLFEDSFE